ncbi:5'-nucleotidase [Kocuria marina]|uniref:5'-nucleotidase n=1 Tax=Kocuria marina TaxID=223184 RepID=UPI0021B19FF1|nr:5'-nucleotidase [Kocuria indica]
MLCDEPFKYMGALNMSLFLSQNEQDVRTALKMGFAAGQVLGLPAADPRGTDLRIAFDFDGVLADDSSERVMQAKGLPAFHAHETGRCHSVVATLPAGGGPGR